ncbi:hypothetical protein MAR_035822 [Mya arenaria]|uniref:Uncharacterized protein n=1 Tax=Mya arenaria TaxID=6604 RepID=A0ABY7EPV1_MYAAR|nr:hypothetical protein MAR_035822 [Mya arenaria]
MRNSCNDIVLGCQQRLEQIVSNMATTWDIPKTTPMFKTRHVCGNFQCSIGCNAQGNVQDHSKLTSKDVTSIRPTPNL